MFPWLAYPYPGCGLPFPPFDLQKFLISPEDQMKLDAIEEWSSDPVRTVEETPPSPPMVESSHAVPQGASSVQPLPSSHPRIQCDKAVQVMLCQHAHPCVRPTMTDVGTQVSESLLIVDAWQKSTEPEWKGMDSDPPVTDRPLASSSPLDSGVLHPLPVLNVQGFPVRDEAVWSLWSSTSSLILSCDLSHDDEEPGDLRPDPNLESLLIDARKKSTEPERIGTDRAASPETGRPLASSSRVTSGVLRPLSVLSVKDVPVRGEGVWSRWSSTSSLILPCDLSHDDDEEPGDLRPDPNLDSLGRRLPSSLEDMRARMLMPQPTPKSGLPSHLPPKRSVPRESQPHVPVDGRPSSPKLNRDRIRTLLGRNCMTADQSKAFSPINLPQNWKRFTFDYYKDKLL